MSTPNLQFNSEIISKIKNFYNSSNEILLLSGASGSSKTEILDKTLADVSGHALVFVIQCFKDCSIDDFLLNFYDSFRDYSLKKEVTLKKSLGETFAQKISFYFKNSDKNSIIVIDNFELVSENRQILDLLSHIAKFENTKVVLVSKNKNVEFFEKASRKIEKIEILPNQKDVFEKKLLHEGYELEKSVLDDFYDLTEGSELYLRMTIRYSKITGIKIKDLLSEFKAKKTTFANFIVLKVISLVPSVYYPFLQNLCALNHAISTSFIEHYKLGEIKQIEYLKRNLVISAIDNKIILKNYFKDYFLSTLSIQEKFKIYKNFCDIYEKELAKSPKDRYLRLSRESIRKQIEIFKNKMPRLNKTAKIDQTNFSYISLAQEGANPWFDKSLAERKQNFLTSKKKEAPKKKPIYTRQNSMSEEDKAILRQYRERKYEQEKAKQIAKGQIDVLSAYKMALSAQEDYQFARANEILAKLLNQVTDADLKIKILENLAQNNEKLNQFDGTLSYLTEIAKQYFIRSDFENYFSTILKCAKLYEHLYRFDSAKNEYLKIINSGMELNSLILSKSHLGLADIFESENNLNSALEHYKNALLTAQNDKDLIAEIYFKTATIYDDLQNFDLAIEFYDKNIECGENKWLSQAYTNCAMIFADTNDINNAIKYLKLAIQTDENTNPQGAYFAARELADIYREIDIQQAFNYMKRALDFAKEIGDNFKIAFAYLEAGDLFYDLKQNENALDCYFKAKKLLGTGISKENEEIITQRINDMKIKMVKSQFERIEARYVEP